MSSIASQLQELLQDTIEALLLQNEKYRDSDKVLSAKIWSIQLGGMEKLKTISAYDFLKEYVNQDTNLYSQESIGRARRKLQEEKEHLRGKKYQERQSHQTEVKEELGYND